MLVNSYTRCKDPFCTWTNPSADSGLPGPAESGPCLLPRLVPGSSRIWSLPPPPSGPCLLPHLVPSPCLSCKAFNLQVLFFAGSLLLRVPTRLASLLSFRCPSQSWVFPGLCVCCTSCSSQAAVLAAGRRSGGAAQHPTAHRTALTAKRYPALVPCGEPPF